MIGDTHVLTASFLSCTHLTTCLDALNPWGDLLAVARAHCVTAPGGLLGLGLMAPQRRDFVRFNGYRSYGPLRWPLITANWQQVSFLYLICRIWNTFHIALLPTAIFRSMEFNRD